MAYQLLVKYPFPKGHVIVELPTELHDVLRPFFGFGVFVQISQTQQLPRKVSTCS